MTAYRDFHSRPRGVDWAATTILVGSVFAAMALLAVTKLGQASGSDGKPLVVRPSTAVLPLNAGQCDLDVAGQRLPDHLGVDGTQVGSDLAQQFTVRCH